MKKITFFLFFLFCGGLQFAQVNSILLLSHDTSIAGSQAKRLADRDSMLVVMNELLAAFDQAEFNTASVLSGLDQYSSIILQETSFDDLTTRYLGPASRDTLKAWLNSGTAGNKKTLFFIGGDQGYNYSRAASPAVDLTLTADLLKFNYLVDNGNVTGQNSITGVAVDIGNVRSVTTTPVGTGFYPDGVTPLTGSTVLYHYTGRGTTDTVAVVGVAETGYNSVSIFLDPRYFIANPAAEGSDSGIEATDNSFFNVMFESILWAISNGSQFPGFVPVELTSFTAASIGNDVKLAWSTGSEINNSGFEIERKNAQSEWQNIGFVEGNGTTLEQQNYVYVDAGLANGQYNYRLKQVDFDGTFEYSSIVEVEVNVPINFVLQQNYPNPFNPSTKITFGLAVDSKVTLKVFDVLGQEVLTLINQNLGAGQHEVNFDATALNSGVYFYRVEASGIDGQNFTSVKKMILTK
ncbi:MAG: T9SS type A sorting domain-containing protein [Ignavibacteriaceae bacterium]